MLLRLLALLAPWASAQAHLLNMTRVAVTFTAGGEVAVKVDVDLTLALGSTEAYVGLLQATPERQRDKVEGLAADLLRWIPLLADGHAVPLDLKRWALPAAAPEKIGDVNVAAMATVEYSGRLPPEARALSVTPAAQAPIEYPVAISLLVPERDVTVTRWVELPGTASRDFLLPEPLPVVAGASAHPKSLDNAAPSAAAPASRDVSPFALALARRIETAGQYLWLGFLHILPRGADHILFVLGLYFLGTGWRPLITQTTAFTVAHTTTLGLSAYGILSLSPRIVEPLIALSIACVALEDIFRPRLSPARLGVVFAFGLLHGLGFASSLSELPLPREQFFTALLAFNFGVDFGQLAVIALAFLAVGWWRGRTWYRARIVVPACGLIAAVGLAWTGQRLLP